MNKLLSWTKTREKVGEMKTNGIMEFKLQDKTIQRYTDKYYHDLKFD